MLVGRTDGGTAREQAHNGHLLVPRKHVSGVRSGHAGQQHSCGAACKGGANGVTHGGQNGCKHATAPPGCGTSQLPEDPGSVLVLSTPARPNERLVLDALQKKVVKVIAITIDVPESHRFAAVVPSMSGVGSGDANVKRGGKGI